jgi:hypothetical protein
MSPRSVTLMSSVTTEELALQHADALVKWQAQLNELEEEITDHTAALESARIEELRRDPTKRPGAVGTEVSQLTRELDGLLKRRDSFARDIQAKKLILEELEQSAEAERAETEVAAAAAEIESTQADIAARWAAFVKSAQRLKDEWSPLAAAVQKLDALPAGELPVSPFAGDLLKAFELALKSEDDSDPFTSLPRVTPRRLPIVRSLGVGAQDVTGYARDMRSTGDYR